MYRGLFYPLFWSLAGLLLAAGLLVGAYLYGQANGPIRWRVKVVEVPIDPPPCLGSAGAS